MNERLENIISLASALRLASVDFEALYKNRDDLSPLAAVEVYLSEQLKIKTEKQNAIRRKRAELPNEKLWSSLISDFRKAFPKSEC